jgi:hypothetical protein
VLELRAPSSFGTPPRLFLKARSEDDEGDLKIRQKELLVTACLFLSSLRAVYLLALIY